MAFLYIGTNQPATAAYLRTCFRSLGNLYQRQIDLQQSDFVQVDAQSHAFESLGIN